MTRTTNVELTLSEWLLLHRRRRGLTQPELADMIGVHYQTIKNWEQERTVPNQRDLVALAVALDVDVAQIRSRCTTSGGAS